jgi:arsenite-transporting ATPase
MVEKKDIYSASMKALADATRTVLILVSRPEAAAMNEAARTYKGLSEIGVANMELLINGVFKTSDQSDPIAIALTKRGQSALEQMPDVLKSIEQVEIPLRASQVLVIDALREFLNGSDAAVNKIEPVPVNLPHGMDEVLDDLARDGHGVIMTVGKGGVGKTTVATRMARDLAVLGLDVLLTTTDPAAHVADAVGDLPDRLEVDQIDPAVEVEKYRAHVMATAGASLNDDGRALLQEDLNSPCTEEIAVFQAFARTVN